MKKVWKKLVAFFDVRKYADPKEIILPAGLSPILRKYVFPNAMVLFPFIIYQYEAAQKPSTIVHELYHFRQIKRWGVLPWYITYLVLVGIWLLQKKSLLTHPMELGAYQVQKEYEEVQG